MQNKSEVAIVVPNWNGEALLDDCLGSLVRQSAKAQVIVVDNGSSDNSVDLIKTRYPSIIVLQMDTNYGFAGGVNRGIELAIDLGCSYIALFNNDAVADKDWLKELVVVLRKQPHTGIATGKLMKIDKKHIDSTGEFIHKNAMPFSRGRNEFDTHQYEKASQVFAASGGASLYRTKMLRQIGLFDEDYFAYFEDVDISFRAQLMGWRVYYQPSARAFHHIGKTSDKLGAFRRYHSVKNYVLLYNKNMPGHLYWKYKPRFFVQLLRMSIGSLRDREFSTYLRAFIKSLVLLPSTLSKRRAIQRHRTVDTAYIQQWIEQGDTK